LLPLEKQDNITKKSHTGKEMAITLTTH
jgi:hypothetical protein